MTIMATLGSIPIPIQEATFPVVQFYLSSTAFQVVEKIDVEEVEDIADAPGFDGDRCESCK